MSIIELLNRSDTAIEMLDRYEAGELGAPAGDTELPPEMQQRFEDMMAELEEMAIRADTAIENVNRAAETVHFPARTVGPGVVGDYHTVSMWGIHFTVERPVHIKSATIDAERAGEFEAVLGRYTSKTKDENNEWSEVHRKKIAAKEGRQRITLDMSIPAGEYLLARDGNFPLRRGTWTGWNAASRDGLTMHGGAKPGDFAGNQFWYYYFSLNIAANESAHVPEPDTL